MYEKLISRNPLFTPLPKHEIKRLKATLRQVEFPPNTILFREGDHGDRLYIILDGQLEIIKALGTPDEQLLNICTSGDYVGEMCLLSPDRSRTASVRTGSSVQLLEVTRADLDALLHLYPFIGYAMARVLSQRLYASETRMLAELNRKNRQLSQAYSSLQSMLPLKLPPDFDLQGNTMPLKLDGSKTSKRAWKMRQEIYRSGLCQIYVETLGGFHLYRGVTVMDEKEWEGYLPKLLLKAIVSQGSHQVPKDQLIEALWPEVAPRSGERNLKITCIA